MPKSAYQFFVGKHWLWVFLATTALLCSWIFLQLTAANDIERIIRTQALSSPTIVLAAQSAPVDANSKQAQDMQTAIDRFIAENPERWGIYIENLATGTVAQHNAQTVFQSASMYKAFVGFSTMHLIDKGTLSLEQEAGVDNLSIGSCLEKMITASDNPCGQALHRLTHSHVATPTHLSQEGITQTNLADLYPTTTAQDVATLFKNLSNGTHLSPSSNQYLLNIFQNQHINNRVPQQLPGGVVVAHKTGDLNGFTHDGGIVQALNGSSYVIVILSGPWDRPADTYDDFADISREIYDIINPENTMPS